MTSKQLADQIWESVGQVSRQTAAIQSELAVLQKLLATYDPEAHWINPRGVAKLYSSTSEDDIRSAVEGRIRAVDDDGHLLISGPVWSSRSTRPSLRPDLIAYSDQAQAAKAHRIIRSTEAAARYLGVPKSTLNAAAFTKALRDDEANPVEMLLDETGSYLWRDSDLMKLAQMIDNGDLDGFLEDAANREQEFGVEDI